MEYEKVPGASPEVAPPLFSETSPAPRPPMTEAEQDEIRQIWSDTSSVDNIEESETNSNN